MIPISKTICIRARVGAAIARLVIVWLTFATVVFAQDTTSPNNDGNVPQSFEELWGDFDPRAEPLDVQVLKEWEDDGITMQVLRFRVGTFKGQVSNVAAVWGYPTGLTDFPGLVQIHGGGQYADSNAVFTNANRGYATISLAWAGRISAPGYRVSPDIVKLFWEGKTDDPRYKLTTDWGAVDGYHAPSRFKGTSFPSSRPHSWTIDAVDSPRNSGWFLCATAARRALTFLENQPQVDANRLGVYGHSMGGKLTVLTATDPRVKAAAPSCGGISDRDNSSELFERTLCDNIYLSRINCPIMFLSPSNDFHGRIDDLQKSVTEIQSKDWRVSCSPHHNHQDTSPYEVATQIWFDKCLRKARDVPKTPTCKLGFTGSGGRAIVTVTADASATIDAIDVYYTRHGQMEGERNDRDNTVSRFWHHQPVRRQGDRWTGELTIAGNDRPLWIYANVTYKLDTPIIGAGYYYRTYKADQYVLSSLMEMKTPDELNAAGVGPASPSENLIEDFRGDWRKEWFTYKENEWPVRTHQVYERRWVAPSDRATLHIEVQSDRPNPFVVGIDGYAAVVQLAGGAKPETITLALHDFRNPGGAQMSTWKGIQELRLGSSDRIRSRSGNKTFGGDWKGDAPKLKNLSWKTE